ncbi:MAG: hypothetical protein DSZ23_04470 [Thermodesulfatator sp.]|nr:MAG: hypothetical protein DSZ23_04470 [Thermodesulfatator sp.]
MSQRENKIKSSYVVEEGAGKGLFLSLVAITSLFLCIFLLSLWIIPYFGFNAIHPWAKWIAAALVGTGLLVVLWASLGLLIKSATGKNLPFFNKMRGITVRLFLPIMTLIGKFFGISKNKIRSSFIRVNNDLVLSEAGVYPPEQILMLMPHCLQNSRCKLRLTYNVRNCKRCGKCSIAGLLELSDKYNIHLAVATGGTIARRIVVERKPRIILAVACQRDLASGIQDTYPLPVYGILNLRPHGPCLDTLVPLDHLEAAIRRFLDPRYYPEPVVSEPVSVNPGS